jgi:hypothetical protein
VVYQHSIHSKIAGGQLSSGLPVVLVEELALQAGEERLGDAVVEAVPDAAH